MRLIIALSSRKVAFWRLQYRPGHRDRKFQTLDETPVVSNHPFIGCCISSKRFAQHLAFRPVKSELFWCFVWSKHPHSTLLSFLPVSPLPMQTLRRWASLEKALGENTWPPFVGTVLNLVKAICKVFTSEFQREVQAELRLVRSYVNELRASIKEIYNHISVCLNTNGIIMLSLFAPDDMV